MARDRAFVDQLGAACRGGDESGNIGVKNSIATLAVLRAQGVAQAPVTEEFLNLNRDGEEAISRKRLTRLDHGVGGAQQIPLLF